MNAHINHVQQLDLHWIGTGCHLGCKVAVAEYFKSVAKAAETGLSENVVRFLKIVVAGDADAFGKLAREINLHCPSSDYNFGRQHVGEDLVLENDKVTFILYLRQTDEQRWCKTH